MKLDPQQVKLGHRLRREAREAGTLTDRQALEARLAVMKEVSGQSDLRYVKYTHGGGVAECRCKVTGELLHGLVEMDGHERKEKLRDGRVVVSKRLVTAYSSRAAHMTIEFDDGSKHQTVVSTDVFRQLESMEEDEQRALLEFIYMSDVEQWLDEEARGFGRVKAAALAHKEPVAWAKGEL